MSDLFIERDVYAGQRLVAIMRYGDTAVHYYTAQPITLNTVRRQSTRERRMRTVLSLKLLINFLTHSGFTTGFLTYVRKSGGARA